MSESREDWEAYFFLYVQPRPFFPIVEEAVADDRQHAAAELPVSDPGYPGAIPLPALSPAPGDIISDAEWAAQNRNINNLLIRGEVSDGR